MLVLTLLGTALWHYSTHELQYSVKEEKVERAYYLARAGAESLARGILVESDQLDNIMNEFDALEAAGEKEEIYASQSQVLSVSINDEEAEYTKEAGEVIVKLERLSENELKITSTGIVDKDTESETRQSVSILMKKEEMFDGAVYAINNLQFHHTLDVDGGDIYTEGHSVKFGNEEVSEEVAGEENVYTHDNVTGGVIKKGVNIAFPEVDFPPEYDHEVELTISNHQHHDNNPYTLDMDTLNSETNTPEIDPSYEKIDIDSHQGDGILTIDASHGSILVDTNEFDMDKDAKLYLHTSKDHDLKLAAKEMDIYYIEVTGDGIAEIYIRDGGKVTFKTPHTDIDIGENAGLCVYLGTGSHMQLQAGGGPNEPATFKGLVYGPEASIGMGASTSFEGSMIVKNLVGTGLGGNITVGGAGSGIDYAYGWGDIIDAGNFFMMLWTD